MTTQKLIAEYTAKIAVLETEIAICTQAIRNFRAGKSSVYFFNEENAVSERKVADAKRQMIVQFCKDLEDVN